MIIRRSYGTRWYVDCLFYNYLAPMKLLKCFEEFKMNDYLIGFERIANLCERGDIYYKLFQIVSLESISNSPLMI